MFLGVHGIVFEKHGDRVLDQRVSVCFGRRTGLAQQLGPDNEGLQQPQKLSSSKACVGRPKQLLLLSGLDPMRQFSLEESGIPKQRLTQFGLLQ